jgi:hypothetical protein
MLVACVVAAGGPACGDDGGSGGGGAGGAGGAELTLDSCETSVGADVPPFFAKYFRCSTITMRGDAIVIGSNGLPPHRSNYWGAGHPNFTEFDTSRGPGYAPNPNLLAERPYEISIPAAPVAKGILITSTDVDGVVGTSVEEYPMGPAGAALDGVALFNPLAAPGDDIENEKYTFDGYGAHPAPDGQYHYHAPSPGPLEVLVKIGAATQAVPGAAEVELYGIMCDGTIVLGCTELGGGAIQSPALDAQGGHEHDVADGEALHFPARYHVHVCPSGRGYTPEIQFYEACSVATGGP